MKGCYKVNVSIIVPVRPVESVFFLSNQAQPIDTDNRSEGLNCHGCMGCGSGCCSDTDD